MTKTINGSPIAEEIISANKAAIVPRVNPNRGVAANPITKYAENPVIINTGRGLNDHKTFLFGSNGIFNNKAIGNDRLKLAKAKEKEA
ncbi:MAG: hypothetical protein Q8S55_17520 [Methylococcaceae bacterium]|nr:hypothetical protein [Methylococcaceae bacterium]